MKKLLFLLTVLTGLNLGASAQNNQIKFGIKAGAVFSNIVSSGSEETADVNTSFYVGGIVDIPVSEIFSIQPGLSFIGKGAKEKENSQITINGNTNSASQGGKLNPFYLEIPVNFIANFQAGKGKFFVGAGPYYAFGITGKAKSTSTVIVNGNITTTTEDKDIKFGNNADSNLKRGDFGINILAGYQLKSGLNIHAGYGLGLSNIVPDSFGFKAKNRVFSVGLGYSF